MRAGAKNSRSSQRMQVNTANSQNSNDRHQYVYGGGMVTNITQSLAHVKTLSDRLNSSPALKAKKQYITKGEIEKICQE